MLSERDAAILEFEVSTGRHDGRKEMAIRDTFGLSPARYYQVLNRVIDLPDALVAEPMTVKRLQRARAARVAARTGRSFDRSSTLSSTTGL